MIRRDRRLEPVNAAGGVEQRMTGDLSRRVPQMLIA